MPSLLNTSQDLTWGFSFLLGLGLCRCGLAAEVGSTEPGISYNTVKFHMRHIYEKLQVHSTFEAVAKAVRRLIH
jgi:DNA-binding NarL/FixJ family response regulator